MGLRQALLAAAAVSSLSACATVPRSTAPAANPWQAFVANYIEATFRASPPFAVSSGRHEFDGRLPDWSPAGLAREKQRLDNAIALATAFDPALLTPEQRFERQYLIAQARGSLFWLSVADQPHTNPAYYAGAIDPSVYVTVPYAPPAVRLAAYTRYLRAIPGAAKQIKANIRTPMPISFVDYSKNAFGGFAEYFPGDGLKAFAGVGTNGQQAELRTASLAAAQAMKGLASWAEAQRPRARANFALGSQRFQQMLYDTEMVDTPLAQLETIGRADLASNQALLRAACARWAAGKSIPDCVDKMNANKPSG
ncbi:MAG: DUF885 domain-containing protein, partial [Sphingomonadales bacterium]|nr:DUF885 domain-containing protein [Sphingomonadales bacterium]